jgi:hypothetical protein
MVGSCRACATCSAHNEQFCKARHCDVMCCDVQDRGPLKTSNHSFRFPISSQACIFTYNYKHKDGSIEQGGYSTHIVVREVRVGGAD